MGSVPHDAPSPRAHSSTPQSPGDAAGETVCERALTLCPKCISCPGSALAPRGFAVCFPIGDANECSVTAHQQLPQSHSPEHPEVLCAPSEYGGVAVRFLI